MLQIPTLNKPQLSIFNYINGFHQLTEQDKKIRANQFSFDLIDVHYNTKIVTNSQELLNEQQQVNFLSLISSMLSCELNLNHQINVLGGYLGLNAEVPHFYGDNNYNNFIQHWYTSHFAKKDHNIFSNTYDTNALFCLSNNQLHFRQLSSPNYPGYTQIFHYIRYCQISRLIQISTTLSKYLCQLTHGTYEILGRYNKEQAAKAWFHFMEPIPENIFKSLYSNSGIGVLWFHMALYFNDVDLFSKWLSFGGKIDELDPISQRKAMVLAINTSHKKLMSTLLSHGIFPTEVELKGASKIITDFLNYKPGQNYISINQFLTHPQRNIDALKLMIEDEENSSDMSSSDDEEDNLQIVNQNLTNNLHNTNNYKILFRGLHFSPGHFTSSKRREAQRIEHHRQPIYSLATIHLASKIGTIANPNFEGADALVKNFFTLLKITPDKTERKGNDRKAPERKINGQKAQFNSLYEHFLQAYVTTYGRLFDNDEQGMWRNFNFYCNKNPLLSTSEALRAAANFALGNFVTSNARYFPRIRISTKEFKHRHLGYVQIYVIDSEYYNLNAKKILPMIEDGTIGVDFHHQHANEVVIESSIPQRYVLGYQMFSIPTMKGDWKLSIQQQYGLTFEIYNQFKIRLSQARREEIGTILIELITRITDFQIQKLERQLTNIAQAELPILQMAALNLNEVARPQQILPLPNYQPQATITTQNETQATVGFIATPLVNTFFSNETTVQNQAELQNTHQAATHLNTQVSYRL